VKDQLFGERGFLLNAASHAQQIGASAVAGFALGAVFMAVAITVYPIVRARSQALALWIFALAAAGLTLAAVEHASVMSMVSLSHVHVNAAPGNRKPQVARAVRAMPPSAPLAPSDVLFTASATVSFRRQHVHT
jgi:hypothetical protein